MKKMKKFLLSAMLVVAMVICSACTQTDIQVKIQEDGSSKFSTETLMGKEEVALLKAAFQKMAEKEADAARTLEMVNAYFAQIESCEVMEKDGKEYYRSFDEVSFNDEQELENYLKTSLMGQASVSVGKDHFYVGMVMPSQKKIMESMEELMKENPQEGTTEEDPQKMLEEMGLTIEQLQQMLMEIKYSFTIEFPSNVTYTNGTCEPNSNKVTWSFSMKEAQQMVAGQLTGGQEIEEQAVVLYAETMPESESALKNDKKAPAIAGVKNKAYYNNLKKVTLSASDAVGVAGITVDGEPTMNGAALGIEGIDLIKEGKHTVKAYDFSGNKSVVTFTYDKTKPSVKGVANGKTYKKACTIKFSDKYGIKSAKLNGKTIKTNKKVSKKGSYTLKVTDKAGNTTTVKFKIKK